jgi:hypothetical protein
VQDVHVIIHGLYMFTKCSKCSEQSYRQMVYVNISLKMHSEIELGFEPVNSFLMDYLLQSWFIAHSAYVWNISMWLYHFPDHFQQFKQPNCGQHLTALDSLGLTLASIVMCPKQRTTM